jgi:hypothetical protein
MKFCVKLLIIGMLCSVNVWAQKDGSAAIPRASVRASEKADTEVYNMNRGANFTIAGTNQKVTIGMRFKAPKAFTSPQPGDWMTTGPIGQGSNTRGTVYLTECVGRNCTTKKQDVTLRNGRTIQDAMFEDLLIDGTPLIIDRQQPVIQQQKKLDFDIKKQGNIKLAPNVQKQN